MKELSAVYGENEYRITGRAILCDEDVILVFGGGTRSHVGAVSMAVYEPERRSATVSTMTVYGHRDDELASRSAKKASSRLGCTVVSCVGIHLNGATEAQIGILSRNFSACFKELLRVIEEDMKVFYEQH
ncbi:MAG: hypothetical protein LUE31_01960 [Lachnospiraceae bacterium]|nr:hypothetical protein [Lachnospiraceae bacterium]